MNPQEKATELIEKFGCNAIERVNYTLDIWELKKDFYLDSLNIYDRTIRYWNKVKNIIKQQ